MPYLILHAALQEDIILAKFPPKDILEAVPKHLELVKSQYFNGCEAEFEQFITIDEISALTETELIAGNRPDAVAGIDGMLVVGVTFVPDDIA